MSRIGSSVHRGAQELSTSIVHNGIAGRVRLQVFGLRGNEELKATLEDIEPEHGIHSISASSITGNILIYYDPERELPEIVGYVEVAVQRPPKTQEKIET